MSKDLQHYQPDPLIDFTWLAQAIWRGKFLILGTCCFFAGLAISLALVVTTPVYEARAQLLLAPQKAQLVDAAPIMREAPNEQRYLATEMSILSSPYLLRNLVREYELQELPEFNPNLRAIRPIHFVKRRLGLIDRNAAPLSEAEREDQLVAEIAHQLARAIHLDRRENSGVVDVMVRAEDPKLAQSLANGLAQNYLDASRGQAMSETAIATAWLAQQLDVLRQDMAQAEEAYDVALARDELDRNGALAVSVAQLRDLRLQIAQVKSDGQTRLASSSDERTQLARLLGEEAELEKRVSQHSAAQLDLRQKEREMIVAQSIYESFLTRHQELHVISGLQFDRVRILARASVPVAPSNPKGMRIIAISLLAGFLLGLAMACLRKRMEDQPPI